jgi:hypothetical protein
LTSSSCKSVTKITKAGISVIYEQTSKGLLMAIH